MRYTAFGLDTPMVQVLIKEMNQDYQSSRRPTEDLPYTRGHSIGNHSCSQHSENNTRKNESFFDDIDVPCTSTKFERLNLSDYHNLPEMTQLKI